MAMMTISTATSTAPGTRHRLKLLALWAIPLCALLAGWLGFLAVQSGWLQLPTSNRGTLVQPLQALESLDIRQLDGAPLKADQHHWLLLLPGGARCEDQCEAVLHLTRQVHIRLDRDAARLRRVYLNAEGEESPALEAHMQAEHRLLQRARIAPATLQALRQRAGIPEDVPAYFLCDPLGNVMMYYTASQPGGDLLADLRQLFKWSE